MTKEQEIFVGEQIKLLATAVCSIPKYKWNNIVFTVAHRKDADKSHFTDILYFREYEDDDYISAYSDEGRALINMRNLRKIAEAYQKLYNVCEKFNSRWVQYTICIDNKGHFESFFHYPQQFNDSDPFDRSNMERWEMQFLYNE